jgi:hypothetical protein
MEIQRRTMTRWSSIGSRHATAAACRQVWGVQEAERSDSASGNSGCIRVGLSPLTQTRRVSSETEAVEARLTSPLQSAVAAATTLPTSLPLSPLTLAFGRSHRAHCRRCAACSRAASVLNVQKCWQADEGCRAALACLHIPSENRRQVSLVSLQRSRSGDDRQRHSLEDADRAARMQDAKQPYRCDSKVEEDISYNAEARRKHSCYIVR